MPRKIIAHRDPSPIARHTTALHGCNSVLVWRWERSWRGADLLVARCSHCGPFAGTVCVVLTFTKTLDEPQALDAWDQDDDLSQWNVT